MSEKYKFHNEEGVYFITPTIVGIILIVQQLIIVMNKSYWKLI